MGIVVGSLARQNWHRQIRSMGLEGVDGFNYVFQKTAQVGRDFGFQPMGIDMSATSLGALESSTAEMKLRLEENKMVPVVAFGGVALSNDAEIRSASVQEARRNLEAASALGARTGLFGFVHNGRVTREGQIRFAILMLKEIGRIAADYDLRICTEDWDYFTSDELIRICVETGLDNVGILSDTGNWLILGEDPVEATQRCLPYTFHAHVRDYVLENETYNGVAVGDGLIDFERVLPVLARAGEEEDIVFSVEIDTDDRDEDECVHRSYSFLKEWLIRNGHTQYLAPQHSQGES